MEGGSLQLLVSRSELVKRPPDLQQGGVFNSTYPSLDVRMCHLSPCEYVCTQAST